MIERLITEFERGNRVASLLALRVYSSLINPSSCFYDDLCSRHRITKQDLERLQFSKARSLNDASYCLGGFLGVASSAAKVEAAIMSIDFAEGVFASSKFGDKKSLAYRAGAWANKVINTII
ncbi:MAG TPA: hypothetical protein VJH68_00090 [Candidatus Nanoarchaeia archaeon]|nr:hypothetical protein [Candidatus Nanoarchaeia archaeon]